MRRAITLAMVLGVGLGWAAPAQAQFALKSGSLVFGGGASSNSSFTLRGAVGPTFAGIAVNDTYGVGSGFWFTTRERVAIDIEDDGPGGEIPDTFVLDQNYPNPFNPTTTLRYGLPERSRVRIEVFNLLGQRLEVLIDAEQQAGFHQVRWDGRIDGVEASTGLYLYRMTTDAFTRTRKMMLVR